MPDLGPEGIHRHRDPVVLPNGTTVVACSFPAGGDPADGYSTAGYSTAGYSTAGYSTAGYSVDGWSIEREQAAVPAFGLYLDQRWEPPWPHHHLDWPDFGLPADDSAVVAALEDVLDRIGRGQLVEIGCLGGHGRTGTAVACLAVLSGLDGDPVNWVRDRYCDRAVETEDQMSYARRFGPLRALYDRRGHRLA